MYNTKTAQDILARYPQTVSKEQLRLICHISKRVAKYYLDNGLIPCKNNGKATHKYEVRTIDVIAFLRDREQHPERYRMPLPSGKLSDHRAIDKIEYDEYTLDCYHLLLLAKVEYYHDLMTFQDISDLTGYSLTTIHRWVTNGLLRVFQRNVHSYVPKELVIRFLMSEEYRTIHMKSRKHYSLLLELQDMMNGEGEENA